MNRSLTTTSLRSHTAVASGFLHKLAHNGTPFARWHQRYYVLYTDGLLRSYKSSRARHSHRVIQVGRKCLRVRFGSDTRSDECSRWPKDCPRELRFSIINSDREYHFYCESEKEFGIWRENLLQILSKLGSAHTSYMERRSSKLNGVPIWLDEKSDDSELSCNEQTTTGSREKLEERPLVEPEKKGERDDGSDSVDGYDTLGPADRSTTALTTVSDEESVGGHASDVAWDKKDIAESDFRMELNIEDYPADKIYMGKVTTNHHLKSDFATNDDISVKKDTAAQRNEAGTPLIMSNYSAQRGIDAAFLEVQKIIDETFNDMF